MRPTPDHTSTDLCARSTCRKPYYSHDNLPTTSLPVPAPRIQGQRNSVAATPASIWRAPTPVEGSVNHRRMASAARMHAGPAASSSANARQHAFISAGAAAPRTSRRPFTNSRSSRASSGTGSAIPVGANGIESFKVALIPANPELSLNAEDYECVLEYPLRIQDIKLRSFIEQLESPWNLTSTVNVNRTLSPQEIHALFSTIVDTICTASGAVLPPSLDVGDASNRWCVLKPGDSGRTALRGGRIYSWDHRFDYPTSWTLSSLRGLGMKGNNSVTGPLPLLLFAPRHGPATINGHPCAPHRILNGVTSPNFDLDDVPHLSGCPSNIPSTSTTTSTASSDHLPSTAELPPQIVSASSADPDSTLLPTPSSLSSGEAFVTSLTANHPNLAFREALQQVPRLRSTIAQEISASEEVHSPLQSTLGQRRPRSESGESALTALSQNPGNRPRRSQPAEDQDNTASCPSTPLEELTFAPQSAEDFFSTINESLPIGVSTRTRKGFILEPSSSNAIDGRTAATAFLNEVLRLCGESAPIIPNVNLTQFRNATQLLYQDHITVRFDRGVGIGVFRDLLCNVFQLIVNDHEVLLCTAVDQGHFSINIDTAITRSRIAKAKAYGIISAVFLVSFGFLPPSISPAFMIALLMGADAIVDLESIRKYDPRNAEILAQWPDHFSDPVTETMTAILEVFNRQPSDLQSLTEDVDRIAFKNKVFRKALLGLEPGTTAINFNSNELVSAFKEGFNIHLSGQVSILKAFGLTPVDVIVDYLSACRIRNFDQLWRKISIDDLPLSLLHHQATVEMFIAQLRRYLKGRGYPKYPSLAGVITPAVWQSAWDADEDRTFRLKGFAQMVTALPVIPLDAIQVSFVSLSNNPLPVDYQSMSLSEQTNYLATQRSLLPIRLQTCFRKMIVPIGSDLKAWLDLSEAQSAQHVAMDDHNDEQDGTAFEAYLTDNLALLPGIQTGGFAFA
ncbi:hypothetical protein H0H93_012213 [Arthromyces matolae]|nr:hypothetical protein H0H93_012213 [Arthromyces matolae]